MLVDTSALLALHHRAEIFHVRAITLFRDAPLRLTHSYVMAEFVPLANVRGLPRLPAITFIADLADQPDVEVVWVDESLHREGLALLHARLDKTYSLCDAVSFVLMRQRGLTDALTTDRHFEREGFVRLLK
jgi:predicted nucleic acid-binding protein